MRIINQSFKIISPIEKNIIQEIEKIGRVCYKSEGKITEDSASKFVKNIIKSGHQSIIEHKNVSVTFITNRGVTHELVRHRLASYSQESTRYVNYNKKEMEFIKPVWIENDFLINVWDYSLRNIFVNKLTDDELIFLDSCLYAELCYKSLLSRKWKAEQAREVLPNCLKTEINVTANLREWRHIFNLRCAKAAHPQIRKLMCDCLNKFKEEIPIIFDDLNYD